jgi:hypothetical protein
MFQGLCILRDECSRRRSARWRRADAAGTHRPGFPATDIVGVHNTPPFASSILNQRELPLDREQAGDGGDV